MTTHPEHVTTDHLAIDHLDDMLACDDSAAPCAETVAPIQPYQARKTYSCPGCLTEIAVGTGHLVVVPHDAPDLRRHWHRGCWHKERRRRGGASVHPS